MLNPDFRDMLLILNEEGVDYLLVGAYAMAAHGYARSTGDIDIWVRQDSKNAQRVWNSLIRFKAPLLNLTLDDLETPDIVFQIGIEPRRIDILTSIAGVEFGDAWTDRITIELDEIQVSILGAAHLIQNKKAAGRPKDLADVIWLESNGE